MGELHQILPVESDLAKTVSEMITGFKQICEEPQRFNGVTKTLKMFDESRQDEETSDRQVISTTVARQIEFLAEPIIKYWDATLQKEATNQTAKADIEIDGQTIASDVPATMLLGLETKIAQLKAVLACIPTLHPAYEWEKQPDGTYLNTKTEERIRTEKDFQFRVVYEATPEHPAQVERWNVDKPIGKWESKVTTGTMSEDDKRAILERCSKLLTAVKQARHRANCADLVKAEIGNSLMDFVLKG
jgi:hypothetical protein